MKCGALELHKKHWRRSTNNAKKWLEALSDTWEQLPPYIITSSPKATGRDELLNYIEEINKSIAQQEPKK